MKKARRIISLVLSATLFLSLFGCSKPDDSLLNGVFADMSKISYSNSYTELKKDKKNKTSAWREGMVSGNGKVGYVQSGSPYSDTFIFQNIHFIMPNKNMRSCPVTFEELESVKQNIVNGRNISDYADYDDVYRFHPGGQLRIDLEKANEKNYMRYTDYATSQTGVRYEDKNGVWQRTAFTSMADSVSVIKLTASDKGAKVNATLSFDDLSSFANFGDSDEANMKYKKFASDSGDMLAMAAHYPSYTNSELRNGGYATVTYVIAENGQKEKTAIEKPMSEYQFSGENNGVKITDADAVYLITVSDRTYDMGALNFFEQTENIELVSELYEKAKAVGEKYTENGRFNYDKALENHLAIYSPQFDASSLYLEDSNKSNEQLLKAQHGKKSINPALAQRMYYAGRYASLCCSGYSTGRLYGMWTGEFNTGWGSKYTMDANVNLQTSAMNTANMYSSPVGYAYFILRQVPDWEENAYATHGFTNAIQAPVHADGDCAVLIETCYSYPFRYWNAGASWMLLPLYEALQTYGNISIPLSDEFDLNQLKSVLDLTDEDIAKITEKGSLALREEILLPLLTKSANYWQQLLTAEYYTDAEGNIHYEKGKAQLLDGETYCIVPGYSPENNPSNYPSPSTANCAIDISACRSNLTMLIDILKQTGGDTAVWEALMSKLPPYLYDESGALKEWAANNFSENNTHRHLSHLYCAWPLFEAEDNGDLRDACKQAIYNRESENEASHALVHRALISARLKDSDSLSSALVKLMNHKIHYDSLMTNHNYDKSSCYCTDFAIGYLGIVNEALVCSQGDTVELLPAVPKDFSKGEIKGVLTRNQAELAYLKWDNGQVEAQIVSKIPQTLTVKYGDKQETIELTPEKPVTVKF